MQIFLKIFAPLVACLLLATKVSARHDIRDYGAMPDDDSYKAEKANAEAFMSAVVAANSTENI